MSPQKIASAITDNGSSPQKRAAWTGYIVSLMFTTIGLVMMLWAGGRGVLIALNAHAPAAETGLAALILEAIAGALTATFGFAMLVQATPSIDTETTSAWTLPEQRTFEDDVLSADDDR